MAASDIVEQLDEYAYENLEGHVKYYEDIRSYVITARDGDFCFVTDEIKDIADLEYSIDIFCNC